MNFQVEWVQVEFTPHFKARVDSSTYARLHSHSNSHIFFQNRSLLCLQVFVLNGTAQRGVFFVYKSLFLNDTALRGVFFVYKSLFLNDTAHNTYHLSVSDIAFLHLLSLGVSMPQYSNHALVVTGNREKIFFVL